MHLSKVIDAQIMQSELIRSWGTTVTTSCFKRMMNEIVSPFGAKAIIKRESLKKPRIMKVSGYYWSIKRGSKIVLHFHLDHRRKMIHLNTRLMNRIIFLTSQTLQHELIHQSQDKRLGDNFYTKHIPVVCSKKVQKKREDMMKYLSLREEVDCFAQNIAMEMAYHYPTESINKVYKNIDNRYLPSYAKYKKVFENHDWTDLKKELLKKVWKWMPKVTLTPRLTTP